MPLGPTGSVAPHIYGAGMPDILYGAVLELKPEKESKSQWKHVS